MNWIKENKFLAVFLAVIVVLSGAVAFLAMGAGTKLTDALSNWETKSAELKRLQGGAPYPEEKNLSKLREQKDVLDSRIQELQQALVAAELPINESTTPTQFQDVLSSTVNAVKKKAAEAGCELRSENFYLGYAQYQTQPPPANVAPSLARQLKAIESVINILIDSKVTVITELDRNPLPGEPGTSVEKAAPATPATPGALQSKPAAAKLVRAQTFHVGFTAEQGQFRRALDSIAASKQPFLVIRNLSVQNEQTEGPSRLAAVSPTAPSVPTDGGALPFEPNTTPAPSSMQYVVGTEKVNVALQIEMIDFAEPAKPVDTK